MSIERRQHSRILINWPVLVNILQGSLEGKVKDISVGGVGIFFTEESVADENMSIVLNPSEQRSIAVVGEKVWSDAYETGCGTLFSMGIRLVYMSPADHQYIAELVKKSSMTCHLEPNVTKQIRVESVKCPKCKFTILFNLGEKVCPACGSALVKPVKR